MVHNVVIPWAIDHKGPSLPWLVSRRLIHSHRRHDRDRVGERLSGAPGPGGPASEDALQLWWHCNNPLSFKATDSLLHHVVDEDIIHLSLQRECR